MGDDGKNIDFEIDELIRRIAHNVKEAESDIKDSTDTDDIFEEFVTNSLDYGYLQGKKHAARQCDSCKKKQIIIEKYKRVCNKEYIPPYVDPDCRDYKIALVIDRIQDDIIEKVFSYLIFRTSIRELLDIIDDPEWRHLAEDFIHAEGYGRFIKKHFGYFKKKQIIEMIFDLNFYYFNIEDKRNLSKNECEDMVKYYIVYILRNKIKESLYKIAKLIELELEYKIAVIEGEIQYLIRCIIHQIVIVPYPPPNSNIQSFNQIASLTDILKILDGIGGPDAQGKHDQRSDFRHIRDTIKSYEKVVRTAFDILNKKIKEYGRLTDQRKFIVGITGICDRQDPLIQDEGKNSGLMPPVPLVVIRPDKDK